MTPDASQAQALVEQLRQSLALELERLKARDMDGLDALQPDKMACLEALQAWSEPIQNEQTDEWNAIREAVLECRDAHRRNEQIAMRQLDGVKLALQTLQTVDGTASVELYDRMGQMSRRFGGKLYSEA